MKQFSNLTKEAAAIISGVVIARNPSLIPVLFSIQDQIKTGAIFLESMSSYFPQLKDNILNTSSKVVDAVIDYSAGMGTSQHLKQKLTH